MAVEDLWITKDGEKSKRYGQGMRYRVRWQGRAKSFRTRKEADRYWLNVRTTPTRPASDAVVDDLVDVWLAGKAGLTKRGLRACEDAARVVRGRWGTRDPASVDRGEVQAWIGGLTAVGKDKVERPASSSQRHKVLQCLSGAMHLGVESGAVRINPCAAVRVPKQAKREAVYLRPGELRALAEAAGRWGPMVWFLGTTGVRIGECCALDVADVDTVRRRARVRKSKSLRGRDVPIPGSVFAMLDLDKSGPLFTAAQGGRVHPDLFRARVFAPIAPEGMNVHDLRHTAASLAIRSGADVKAVQTMLGHSSAQMTLDLYSHLWDEQLDTVGERVDLLLGADGN